MFSLPLPICQNSLGMMPSVPNTGNATGVPNVKTVPNVLKITNNDPSVPNKKLSYRRETARRFVSLY